MFYIQSAVKKNCLLQSFVHAARLTGSHWRVKTHNPRYFPHKSYRHLFASELAALSCSVFVLLLRSLLELVPIEASMFVLEFLDPS